MLSNLPSPLSPQISEVIESNLSPILQASADLLNFNTVYLQSHAGSAPHVQAALMMRQLLDPATMENNSKDVIRTLALEEAELEDAIRGLEMLKEWGADEKFSSDYVSAAKERWPEAIIFQK